MTYKKRATRGLPAGLPDSAYERLAKVAHPIWDLRTDDEEDGKYQLVRKKEEPAVDMRRSASLIKTAATTEPEVLKPGDRVNWVRRGEVAPAIVINVHQPAATADLEFEDTCETEFDIPLDMLMVDLPAMPQDPFSPAIAPTSKLAQYMLTVVQEKAGGEHDVEVPATEASVNDLVRAAQLYGVTTIHAADPRSIVAHAPKTDSGKYVLVVSAVQGKSLSDAEKQQAIDALHRRGKYAKTGF